MFKLSIKTPERRRRSGVVAVNSEHISHLALVLLLLTLTCTCQVVSVFTARILLPQKYYLMFQKLIACFFANANNNKRLN